MSGSLGIELKSKFRSSFRIHKYEKGIFALDQV